MTRCSSSSAARLHDAPAGLLARRHGRARPPPSAWARRDRGRLRAIGDREHGGGAGRLPACRARSRSDLRRRLRGAQPPPATAGRIVELSPSATGVSSPFRNRMPRRRGRRLRSGAVRRRRRRSARAARRAGRKGCRAPPNGRAVHLRLGLVAGGVAQLRRELDRDRHHATPAAANAASNSSTDGAISVTSERAAHGVERLQARRR